MKVEQNDADEAFFMLTGGGGALAILMEYSTLNKVIAHSFLLLCCSPAAQNELT